MKKKTLLSALCAGSLFLTPAAAAHIEDFPDAAGHWAYPALTQAVDDGLLQGIDGRLAPSGSLTTAQMAAILNRVLGATNTSRNYPGTPEGRWYTTDAQKAASLGTLPADGSLLLGADVTRAQVFQALAAAFGLEEAAPDESVLNGFSDANLLTAAQRRAAAVLVRDGILSGSQDGSLSAARGITRAEFVSLIYRIQNAAYLAEYRTDRSETDIFNPDAKVQLYQIPPVDPVFDPGLDYGRVILRGENMLPVFTEGEPVSIQRLTIAATGTDFTLSNENRNSFGAVIVGGGTGKVTLDGSVTNAVEITGSDRTVDLRGMTLDTLLISGTDNTVTVDESTKITSLRVLSGAARNKISVNGSVETASLAAGYTELNGSGHAGVVTISGTHTNCTLAADKTERNVDDGLDGVQVTVQAPKVAPGGQITATASISNVDKPIVCTAQWYIDGKADSSFVNPAMEIREGQTSSYRHTVSFTKDMPLEHTIGFVLTYKNSVTGETEKIVAGATAIIENYPASHYLDASSVLAKVNSTYRRGNKDYSKEEKTIFVNAKGYSSKTQYLIWVSRSAQKVNIFQGAQGNWKLIHEFACATGASSTPTPVGVTYVTYKQTDWTTPNYTCRPIVRFYPNTGYAFHSRLYYPNSNRLKDASMGFPVSHGCVRMMDEGINWIYNNIPTRTTVVIF